MALGFGGGAAYCGTFTSFKSFGCSFADNSAPGGRGGALRTLSETVVEILHSTAFKNTATLAGFGSFELTARVKISNTTMEQGAASLGGALSFQGVRDATITKSAFINNSALGLSDYGGAVSCRESTVNFAGVQFSKNTAKYGDGGGIAVFHAQVSWSKDAETCSRTDVVMDLTKTTEHCGQYYPDVGDVCSVSGFSVTCASVNFQNPFVTDRSVPYCTHSAASVDTVVCCSKLVYEESPKDHQAGGSFFFSKKYLH